MKWELLTQTYERRAEARKDEQSRTGAVRVYLGVNVEGFVVDESVVSVDGTQWISKQYSALQAQALRDGGWDLVESGVSSGSRRALTATVRGHFPNSRTGETFSVDFASRLPATSAPLSVVLLIEGVAKETPTRETVAPIVETETFPVAREPMIYSEPNQFVTGVSQYQAGTQRDPNIQHARFLLGIEDAAGAAYALMDAARYGAAENENAYRWALAGVKASLSIAQGVDAILASADPEGRGKAYEAIQLALATDALNAGQLKEVDARFQQIDASTLAETSGAVNMLRARLALARGQNEQAMLALHSIPTKQRSPFAEYNLAVAEIRADQKQSGLDRLSGIGALRDGDKAERALRDKANLELALHYFELGRPADALRAVKKVPLQGPFASQALLAAGWIVLGNTEARSGEPLTALSRWFTGNAGQASATPSSEDMREALRYWDALVQRDMADPMVQSGVLSSAFVLEQLGLFEEALSRYQRAADALWDAGRGLQSGLQALQGPDFYSRMARTGDRKRLGRFWSVRGLPDVAASYWLPQALASARFQDGLRNYRDLEYLASELVAASGGSVSEAREPLLTRARMIGGACLATIRADLVKEVRERQRRVKANLERAHLAIARVTERMIATEGAGAVQLP